MAVTESVTVEKVAAAAVKDGGPATFAQLMSKPRRTLEFPVYSLDAAGNETSLRLKYRAMIATQYDELQAGHPPNAKERANGQTYHQDTFAPALIAAVAVTPTMTLEQATELYSSPEWAGGEIATLFVNALRVCNAGTDVPFNARD
jgi:hypothetical protein